MLDEKFEFRGTLLVARSASKVAKQAKTDEVSHHFSAEKNRKEKCGCFIKTVMPFAFIRLANFFLHPNYRSRQEAAVD